MFNFTPRFGAVAAVTAALALAACTTPTKPGDAATKTGSGSQATNGATNADPDGTKGLGDRAVLRWNNIIGAKFDQAYEVLSPGYRLTHDKNEYADIMANRPVRWTSAKFLDQSCDSAEVCSVKIMIEFTISMPGVGTVPSQDVLLEKWIKSDGQWYFLPANAAARATQQ